MLADFSQCPILGAFARAVLTGPGRQHANWYVKNLCTANGVDYRIDGSGHMVVPYVEPEPFAPSPEARAAFAHFFPEFTIDRQLEIEAVINLENAAQLLDL